MVAEFSLIQIALIFAAGAMVGVIGHMMFGKTLITEKEEEA